MAFLDLREVSKQYGPRRVLANINLAVEEGEFVCIVGSSASGKTTLMKIAAGLVAPDSGSITIGGQAVTSFPRSASSAATRSCAVAGCSSRLTSSH